MAGNSVGNGSRLSRRIADDDLSGIAGETIAPSARAEDLRTASCRLDRADAGGAVQTDTLDFIRPAIGEENLALGIHRGPSAATYPSPTCCHSSLGRSSATSASFFDTPFFTGCGQSFRSSAWRRGQWRRHVFRNGGRRPRCESIPTNVQLRASWCGRRFRRPYRFCRCGCESSQFRR